jgi:chromate reductase, NAD(P)H dehydrogenase (quinone)
MNLLAFAGSSSRQSINKQLVTYAVSLFQNETSDIIDLNDYELPLFSVDREKELGKPDIARAFLDKIEWADVLVISLAEHNGAFTGAFKNIYDWASRQQKEVWGQKPMLLMATSPGRRGGQDVLDVAQISLPKYGGNIKAIFSLPSFNHNFDAEAGKISNKELDDALKQVISDFRNEQGF